MLGPRHRDALTSIDHVGRLLQRQGRLAEAEPLLREAEAGRREMLGERHREALLSLDHLGGLLHDDGKLAEAEPLLHKAMQVRARARVHGTFPPHASHLPSPASHQPLTSLSRLPHITRLLLQTRIEVLGASHRETLTSYLSVGRLQQEQGRMQVIATPALLLLPAWPCVRTCARARPMCTSIWAR